MIGTRFGPYEIGSPLGAGGMGEVWRARDTRLGRDVAVKVLPGDFAADPDRLRRFEQEARAAAALNHPNILVLFDVGRHEGQPYLVTELLEGESLREQIGKGGLTVSRSVDLGIQIARGLAAAHERGIVHRDLKPANVFVTREGTVKILDFGLAKLTQPISGVGGASVTSETGTDTASGLAVGTVGYMAPEQIRLQPVDHRADVFAFGCVLYEMLSGRRAFQGETPADTLSAILTRDPPALSSSVEQLPPALDRIVRRCLEKRPDDRFTSARDLGFALQAVAESVPREAARRPEEIRPYSGLAAFTEADAERFFGREDETAVLWRKIPERSLLALIGPSGAGKTSFLRAGIVPHAPPGWRCLVATPGQTPFAALARALVPQFAGDTEATSQLFQIHEPEVAVRIVGRWRERCDHALLIVDQFEELFTLNGEDVQARFGDLLGKIASLDGVHVLLSMRDDFLIRTQDHPSLRPILLDLTALLPLSGQGLRKAVVEPARRFGFTFEDDGLVEEMVQAVEGERGALPLLAFAVARLWEERDRERKLLTRAAYERLGGVAGALAQHAEAALERIGSEREPIVRELFRNLATAQQTRCVVDAEVLLSVFPEDQRSDARQVVTQLVDARLLTSFEVEAPDGTHHHRIEIVHESLLQRWPRLMRWQTQDADAAQLRDQLRQAAHLWEEKGRPDDLLWTGTSYQEYQVWRARYPGGLSEAEETFARAMTSAAGRRRRRRRIAVAAVIVLLSAGLAVVGSFWRRSVQQTRRAEAETRLREAAQLLALGRLRLGDHPNAALAYAIASLEEADNGPARRFAVEALWQGPPALFISGSPGQTVEWSPDGRWLALGGAGLALFERGTNERRQLSSSWEVTYGELGFTADSQRLVTRASMGTPWALHVWALPKGQLERTLELADASYVCCLAGDRLLQFVSDDRGPEETLPPLVHRISLEGTDKELLGRWEPGGLVAPGIDPSGMTGFSLQGGRLVQQQLDLLLDSPRVLGMQEEDCCVYARPWRDRAVTGDSDGDVRVWDVSSARLERTLKSPADARYIALDPTGRFLAASPYEAMPSRSLRLFDLAAPRTAESSPLLGGEIAWINYMKFSPDGSWLASEHGGTVILWNMLGPRSTVLGRQKPPSVTVAFTRDGHLLSASHEGVLRRWPVAAEDGDEARALWSRPGSLIGSVLEPDPDARFVILADQTGWSTARILVVRLDGSKTATHEFTQRSGTRAWPIVARLAPSGSMLAAYISSPAHPEATGLRILDLVTGDERTLDTLPRGDDVCEEVGSDFETFAVPAWLPDGRLLSDGNAGLLLWDLATGTSQVLRECKRTAALPVLMAMPDGHAVLRLDAADQPGAVSSLTVFDLDSHATREIGSHGNRIGSFVVDSRGAVLVTGSQDGVVRVGPIGGGEPRTLFGHTGPVSTVALSPDGRWIASGSNDGTIRLWPMPDLSKPPLHTWPREELLAKLKSLTNLRAVRDPASDTGWKIEIGPFPGWATVPEWNP